MVLAALWPGQALLLGLLYARRAAGLPRRLTGLTAGGLALVLGGFWGTNGYERGQLLALAPTDSAGVSLGGEWHTSDGRHLHLGADGTFTVTGAPRELFDAGADLGGRIDATGTWESNGSGFVSNVVAVDLSPEPGSPADRLTDGFPSILTLYKIGSTPLLCVDSDDDSLCDYVYRH
jgi:hypothetical protein